MFVFIVHLQEKMSFFKGQNSSFYNEDAVLKISAIVSWKKEQKVYNFKTLPDIAIIAIKKNVFSRVITPFTKIIKGINGLHYNYKSKFLLCSEFGMGSASIITLLEELKELGVKKFIFLGVAGILDTSVKEGDAYIISNVFSSVGSSFFYAEEENIECYDSKWFEKIRENFQLESKISWSTDCPFRETASLLAYYKSKNCSLVEMETAGMYAFSRYYKVPSVAILIGADSLISSQWKMPKNISKLLKVQQDIVNKLIKL